MTVTDEHRARRAEWIRVLRTEGLRQAQQVLCKVVDHTEGASDNGLGYCCLGVAELSVGNVPRLLSPTGRWSMNGSFGVMSEATMRLLGFDDDNPILAVEPDEVRLHERREKGTSVVSLAELNDDLGMSLAEIADVIEAQPDDWTGTYER